MKRRDFTSIITCGLIISELSGCARLGFSFGNSSTTQGKTPPPQKPAKASSTSRTSRSNTLSGITDIKTLGNLLEKARHPLNESQINYLLTLKPGPEFAAKMGDILTDVQKEALKNASGRRRGRR